GTGFAIFTDLSASFLDVQPGIILITLVSLTVLIAWNKVPFLKNLKLIPGALVAVLTGTVLNEIFLISGSSLAVTGNFLVNLPVPTSMDEFNSILISPNFSAISDPNVWV